MKNVIRIGIIGDYDGRPSHVATDDSLKHCSDALSITIESVWLSTTTFDEINPKELLNFDGFWCAPGSPYKSMKGALNAIRFIRENDFPFIGTCGGFQHAVIEFGKNVLHIDELMDQNFDPYLPNDFITPLSCSLVGQTKQIKIKNTSMVYDIYCDDVYEERYNCSFGLGRVFQEQLEEYDFQVVGTDENGEARIMLLNNKSFYIVTLFQPQLSSTIEKPHPLIKAFISACYRRNVYVNGNKEER